MKNTLTLLMLLLSLTICSCGIQKDLLIRTEKTLSLKTKTDDIDYIYGQIQVPMNRANPDSKTIEVSYYFFPRKNTASPTTPPLFDLPAGPSGRDVPGLLSKKWYFPEMIEPYLEYTDYIVVNHRGFLDSFDTSCPQGEEIPLSEINNDEFIDANRVKTAQKCRKMWEDKGVDLTGFNTVQASADVIDLAKSMGFEKIQIMGNSYGSHWAINTLRNYPDMIVRATLNAIEGPDHTYDFSSQRLKSIKAIAKAVEADPKLRKHIPEQGIVKAYQETIQQLDLQPITIKTKHPKTGEVFDYVLDGDDLRERFIGYNSRLVWRYQMREWPNDMIKVLKGDYDELVTEQVYMKLDRFINDAAYFHTDCASGISINRGKQLRAESEANIVGKTWDYYDKSCANWDADHGEDFRKSFKSDVPTLLVQGNWDTLTFSQNAIEMMDMLTHGVMVHVEGGSHGALREAKEKNPAFNKALHHWLATGEITQMPKTVVLPPMKWNPYQPK